MSIIRVIVLWHMHQPFYKDLVSGEYRLPWVRLHALKDYYGMVKLMDEFPTVHTTFNLVPSLIAQIQDYAAGTARDPFLNVASKPAAELDENEQRFALQYLFQANVTHMIGRYPRYRELYEKFRQWGGNPERAAAYFTDQDFTDLQVLSQLAWFDEFFLEEPDIAALVSKGRDFTRDDQRHILSREQELIGRVLPAYASAAQRGLIEISATPYYHPILPLLCDTNNGSVSTLGRPLPQRRFQHPEDAREQLKRALDSHEQLFGVRPKGVWPSEGSVADEVLAIGHELGVNWMATDEGVLSRSLGARFDRDPQQHPTWDTANRLYTVYRYERGATRMHMVFRDHTLSDLIGFVYSGMPPADAANHLIRSIKESTQPLTSQDRDVVVPIILDGENAWEYYPRSGREFLRRFFDGMAHDAQIEAVTVSEAIERQKDFGRLEGLVPGSWINANFNVWIGAPEDNKAWDYLADARDFYAANAHRADPDHQRLAFEEVLIAEGSDWNWWYGPEHHSANDPDFDELYRKHLSNVYLALGATPPEYLAQPIAGAAGRPYFAPQTAYIHPKIDGENIGYFDWLGAAMYTADQRTSAMHGKQFLLDSVYAGIDEDNVYGHLEFAEDIPAGRLDILVNLACGDREMVIEVEVDGGRITATRFRAASGSNGDRSLSAKVNAQLATSFEFSVPRAPIGAHTGKLRLRFSVWINKLPVDALPLEGWMELDLLSEDDLLARS